MYINILNSSFNKIGIIDNFSSLIWTKRYFEYGDFEVYVRADTETLELFQQGTYVSRDDDDMICIIETIRLNTDVENGNYLTVSGRCLKSMLERRIVWYQTNLYGRANLVLEALIDHNAINTDNINRDFLNLSIGSTPYTDEVISKQITGDNLYDCVLDFCKTFGWGFEIVRTGMGNGLKFNAYEGKNRTDSQSRNPKVVFSAEYDNLPRTNYLYSVLNYRNTARIAGEGEGTLRKTAIIGNDNTDLDRYEVFVDARDVSSNNGEINESDYHKLLLQRGKDKLSESPLTMNVDGEIDATEQYVYKEDYFVGDIVQIKTEYGISATARILEVIECEDETGYKIIPTFSSWKV